LTFRKIWVKKIRIMMKYDCILGLTQKFYSLYKTVMFLAMPFVRKAEMEHCNLVKATVKKRLDLEVPCPDL
jgi:hypothetical protein